MKTLNSYDPDCAEAAAELWQHLANHGGEDADAQLIICDALKEYACECDKRIDDSQWAQKYKEACIDIAVLHERIDPLIHHLAILAAEDSQCSPDWVEKKKAARAVIARALAAPSNTKMTDAAGDSHPLDARKPVGG